MAFFGGVGLVVLCRWYPYKKGEKQGAKKNRAQYEKNKGRT